MQFARTGYLAAYSLIPTRRPKPGLDGEISSRRECFQRRRVGSNRERYPLKVRGFILNGGQWCAIQSKNANSYIVEIAL
jgi:hypothetical protein